MSNPDPNFDPENVKDEDDAEHEVVEVEPDDQPNLNAYYDEQKRMEEHFTKEPEDFGGQHYI